MWLSLIHEAGHVFARPRGMLCGQSVRERCVDAHAFTRVEAVALASNSRDQSGGLSELLTQATNVCVNCTRVGAKASAVPDGRKKFFA